MNDLSEKEKERKRKKEKNTSPLSLIFHYTIQIHKGKVMILQNFIPFRQRDRDRKEMSKKEEKTPKIVEMKAEVSF